MLSITIPDQELFDEEKEEFIVIKGKQLQLEHSLISLQKWEEKHHKPFLGKSDKTMEEILDYLRCMTLTPNVDPDLYKYIPEEQFKEIWNYIEDTRSATWFNENNEAKSPNGKREIVTAEIIYYWMVELGIPTEYRKWHLNQLLTLIRVTNIKRTPPKKMGKKGVLSQNAHLNAQRRARMGSKG